VIDAHRFLIRKTLHTEHSATKSIAEPEGRFASERRKRNTPSSDFVREHSAFSYKSTADRQRFARSVFPYTAKENEHQAYETYNL
jgi:hypothetical protein